MANKLGLIVSVTIPCLATLLVGFILPKTFISNNVAAFKGTEEAAARYAINESRRLLGEFPPHIPPIIVYQVISVRRTTAQDETIPTGAINEYIPGYEVRIQLYSLFGIPAGVVLIDDAGPRLIF
jgi:hypothetical protein